MSSLFKAKQKAKRQQMPCRVTVSPDEPPPDVTSHYVVDFGTSATVIARFETATGDEAPQIDFIVGQDRTFPSALRIDTHGNVTSVGDAALRPEGKGRLESSFKRHLERESRDPKADLGLLTSQVSNYIRLALESVNAEVVVTPNTHVYISVPNGFDGPAIQVIREGVLSGLRGKEALLTRNVHVVREGEAVAQLWRHREVFSRLTRFVELRREGRSGSSNAGPDNDAAFVVLDIGAGTTDLTLLQSGPSGRSLVLMNAGVPVGGTDVDHLLVASLALPEAWGEVGEDGRQAALTLTRDKKEGDEQGSELESLIKEVEGGWQPALMQDPIVPPVKQRSGQEAARFVREGLQRLAECSVRGLFALIPPRVLEVGLPAVILSGRGSLASPVRKEVLDWAHANGARVLTLEKSYDLKLAVTYGCVAIDHAARHRALRASPPSTIGCWLSINVADRHRLEADTWIDAECPILWRMPAHSHSIWYLQRTAVSAELVPIQGQERLGLLTKAAERRSREPRLLFVLWGVDDRFYSPVAGRWVEVGRDLPQGAKVNPLTTLPFSFPAMP